jgi:hypothetical protein
VIAAEYVPGLIGVYAVTVQIPPDAASGLAQAFAMIVSDAQGNQYWLQTVSFPIQ